MRDRERKEREGGKREIKGERGRKEQGRERERRKRGEKGDWKRQKNNQEGGTEKSLARQKGIIRDR